MRWTETGERTEPYPWIRRFAFLPKLVKLYEEPNGIWIWWEPYWERTYCAWCIDGGRYGYPEIRQRKTADGALGDVIINKAYMPYGEIGDYLRWRDKMYEIENKGA